MRDLLKEELGDTCELVPETIMKLNCSNREKLFKLIQEREKLENLCVDDISYWSDLPWEEDGKRVLPEFRELMKSINTDFLGPSGKLDRTVALICARKVHLTKPMAENAFDSIDYARATVILLRKRILVIEECAKLENVLRNQIESRKYTPLQLWEFDCERRHPERYEVIARAIEQGFIIRDAKGAFFRKGNILHRWYIYLNSRIVDDLKEGLEMFRREDGESYSKNNYDNTLKAAKEELGLYNRRKIDRLFFGISDEKSDF